MLIERTFVDYRGGGGRRKFWVEGVQPRGGGVLVCYTAVGIAPMVLLTPGSYLGNLKRL